MPVTIEQIENLKPGQSLVYYNSSPKGVCYAHSGSMDVKNHLSTGYIEDRYILTQRLLERTTATLKNVGDIGTFEYIVTRKRNPPDPFIIGKNKEYRERLLRGDK